MTPNTPIRFSVLSDDQFFRDSMLLALTQDPGLRPIEARDVVQTEEGVAAYDIAVLDARITNALAVCAALARQDIRVLLVSAPDNDAWAEEALDAGARGIVLKTARTDSILKAIRVAHAGGIWACRRWLNARVMRFATMQVKPAKAWSTSSLSAREREVLEYAATGIRNKQLADQLAISEATVKAHLTHIFKKLGVGGRAELAAVYHDMRSASDDRRRQPAP